MSTAHPDPTTRKPSGSSTRSGGHSPSGSPGHAQSQRKGLSGNMLGMGLASTSGLGSLNSGWQVWGNSPASARHPSTSSAASVPEPSMVQPDSSYRSGLGDAWGSRSTSGGWDEMIDSPHMQDLPQLDRRPSLPLHQGRQRRVPSAQSTVLSTPPAATSKQAQFSPQRYGAGRESVTPSLYSPASPPKSMTYGLASSPYSAQQHLVPGSSPGTNYDSLQSSSFAEDELSMALRGMAVADDLNQTSQHQSYRPQIAPNASQPSIAIQPAQPSLFRAPPVQQHRLAYGGYPQSDYTTYYTGPSPRMDYQYHYDAYRATPDASLYASSPALSAATTATAVYPGMGPHPQPMPDIHGQQPGVFYDYSGSSRAMGSQYYYPTQAIVFHPPPSHSPMDKKRDTQHYNVQHNQPPPQGIMYANFPSSTSPHPQAYPTPVDYHPQHPMMIPPGNVYGHAGLSPTPMQLHHAHGGRGRRRGEVERRAATRSPLLDEFRVNKARKWELKDIIGHIVEFSGDQHGSRFIQEKLEMAGDDETQIIFDEIVPHHVLQLIQDVFGNYVIQKLFEHGTSEQKTILADTMEGHILPLSLQMYGCRVVQKAVEFVSPEQQSAFVQELETSVLQCVKDANGNHVIQKLIQCVPPERLSFLKAFKGNVYDLATHPYGCRVLQRCFEHLPEEYTRPLIDELHKHVNHLMQDQFGNYVIQFVLEHGKPEDRAVVVSKLRGQMLHMARHKFASNVCEKALTTADPESRRLLIEEIMTPRQDGLSPILTMMKDQFANYVLQRALSVVEGEQKEALAAKVRPQLMNMRRYSSAYSKHLVAIERLLERCSPSHRGDATPQENVATSTTLGSPLK